MTCPTNVVINVTWNDDHLPDDWYLPIGRRYMESSEYVSFKFHMRTVGHRLLSFNVFFGDVPSIDLGGVPSSTSIQGHYFDASTEVLHVMFVNSDDLFIEFNQWLPVETPSSAPIVSPPTLAPIQTIPPTASPTAQPTLLPVGSPCTHGSSCKTGFCGGMSETKCMEVPQCT